MKLKEKLKQDIHYKEGLHACINCGTCTAICPAAEFYNYDPREVIDIVQQENEQQLETLLKSDTIWYCGECMSCRTRCPRNNTPGLIIIALRALSQETGLFVESEKGRQQIYLKRTIGHHILETGYCLFLEGTTTETHPELGPVWDWRQKNWYETMKKLGANYKGEGPGTMRKIPQEALQEIDAIFKVTGGHRRFEQIEKYSALKAAELKLNLTDGTKNEYVNYVYNVQEKDHINRN